MAGALKVLAKDLGLCVLLLAQINREQEKRENKRPLLSELRESGDLDADADIALLLFREAYYLEQDPNVLCDGELARQLGEIRNTLEINVAKNRQGPTGPVHVFCHPGSGTVRNAAETDRNFAEAYGSTGQEIDTQGVLFRNHFTSAAGSKGVKLSYPRT